jgi:beta-aspartyl-peptidase (threonine type)
MRSTASLLTGWCLLLASATALGEKPMYAIAIHGGAGTLPRAEMTRELEAQYREDLQKALDTGYAVLEEGRSSMDAVTAAVRVLEDSPMFNAGKGAVFNREAQVELDAAVMDGATLKAGAVAGLKHIKNPVDLARLVMEQSNHVLLISTGAEEFALDHGMTLVPNSYFHTERRREQLERARRGDKTAALTMNYFGTVGAVARDGKGNIAAATSTGGMTGKRAGRVGDSPIIGAGTYANNATAAISGTGHGEFFMRWVVAHDIHALMEYRGLALEAAVNEVVQKKLKDAKGEGGIIAVDAKGNLALSFNSEGMFRGARTSQGRNEVAIY